MTTKNLILNSILFFLISLQIGCATMQNNLLSKGHNVPATIAGIRVADVADGDRSLVRRVHLNAEPQTVFDFMVDFERMPQWLPGLNHVSVDNRQSHNGPDRVGVGTRRSCALSGASLQERIVHFDSPRSFAYKMTSGSGAALPFSAGTGIVEIQPALDGGSNLSYHVIYETKDFHPMSPLAPLAMGKQLGKGLDNLVERFGGHSIEPEGKAVPWF